MPFKLSDLGIISSIIPGPGDPNYLFTLRAVGIEFGMTVILPNPLAVRTPELNHVNILQS